MTGCTGSAWTKGVAMTRVIIANAAKQFLKLDMAFSRRQGATGRMPAMAAYPDKRNRAAETARKPKISRSAAELRQHGGGPGEPLDERAQELPVEAQLAAVGERLEVRRLDLEELHLGDRDDRSRAPRAVAGEIGHLAEAVALLEDVQQLAVLHHFHLPADDDEERLPDLALEQEVLVARLVLPHRAAQHFPELGVAEFAEEGQRAQLVEFLRGADLLREALQLREGVGELARHLEPVG